MKIFVLFLFAITLSATSFAGTLTCTFKSVDSPNTSLEIITNSQGDWQSFSYEGELYMDLAEAGMKDQKNALLYVQKNSLLNQLAAAAQFPPHDNYNIKYASFGEYDLDGALEYFQEDSSGVFYLEATQNGKPVGNIMYIGWAGTFNDCK